MATLGDGAHGAPRGPNVLLIIADDLNCDLGCYGHRVAKTPHLDALAARGVRFDRAYAQYPVCNPSRTSFLTGLRPETTGILDNQTHFRKRVPSAVTLPELFRKNGYFAAGLGKVFHPAPSPDGARSEVDDPVSFDHVFHGKATHAGSVGEGRNLTGGKLSWCRWLAVEGGDEDLPDGQLTAEAVRLMRQPRDRPFFLAVGYARPHDPFHAPKAYFARYPPAILELPKTPDGYKPPYPQSLGGGAFQDAFDRFGDAEKREFLRAYYAGVSFVDAQVGKLLAALDRLKLADDTIVLFIGDHGYELGVRNWWSKSTLFERSCRTPLIVLDPKGTGNGRAAGAITELLGIYPTLVERCGLTGAPENLEGRSFRDILDDPTREGKTAAVTVVARGKYLGKSVRTPRWRYTEWDAGRKGAELYDHVADPGEWNNLAGNPAHAATVAELRRQLQ